VVPSVPISNGGTLRYTSYLIAIVPPSHHSRIFWSVVPDPFIPSQIVVDDDFRTISQPRFEQQLRVRHVKSNLVAVLDEFLCQGFALLIYTTEHNHCNKHTEWPVNNPKAAETFLGFRQIFDFGWVYHGPEDSPGRAKDRPHASSAYCRWLVF